MALATVLDVVRRRVWPRRPPAAAVLVYHRVARLMSDPFGQAVTPETFERQLRVIRDVGSVVTTTTLTEALEHGESVNGMVAVTFDDGYVDNLTTALPIAERMGIPITVFVAAEPVLNGGRFWWDTLAAAVHAPDLLQARHAELRSATAERRAALMAELAPHASETALDDAGRPLTRDELRGLALRASVTIGAHTMTHPSLSALDASEQRTELAGSRRALEHLLGTPVRLLAYPFGKPDNVSQLTRALARETGFAAAFTTVPHPVVPGADRFAIPRLTVHEWPDDVFSAKLAGLLGLRGRPRGA